MIIYLDKNKSPNIVCDGGNGKSSDVLNDILEGENITIRRDMVNKCITISSSAKIDVIDNFDSTSTTDALSANKGKELYNLIGDVSGIIDLVNREVVWLGTVADKLRYTLNAVNDIQAAIEEKKISITDTTPLKSYGDKIREIRTLDFNKFRPWIIINNTHNGYLIDNIQFSSFEYAGNLCWNYYNMGTTRDSYTRLDIKFCNFEETTVNVVSNTYS